MTDQKIALRERARRERSQKFIPCNFNVILKAPEIVSASTIASYISYELEPSTVEINEAFLRDGKTLVLPRINGDQLEWVTWNGDPNQLTAKKKILEPLTDRCCGCSSTAHRSIWISIGTRWRLLRSCFATLNGVENWFGICG